MLRGGSGVLTSAVGYLREYRQTLAFRSTIKRILKQSQ